MPPALGIVGLGIWIAYTATRFPAFAWVSFGVLLAAIAAGLTWYTVNRRHAAARAGNSAPARPVFAASADGEVDATAGGEATRPAGRRYPPRRLLIHRGGGATPPRGPPPPPPPHPHPRRRRGHHAHPGHPHPPHLRPLLTRRRP